jgi:hypothetical protein
MRSASIIKEDIALMTNRPGDSTHLWDVCILQQDYKSSPATRHGGAWGENRYSSYSFTTSALDGGEWSASRPGRAFTPGTHCTGGWVDPRAGLNTEDRGKILCSCRGSNPDRPVVQPVVRHYTAWANPAPSTRLYGAISHKAASSLYLPQWETEISRNQLNQDWWSPVRDLDTALPKYEAGVIITRPRCSIITYWALISCSWSETACRTHELVRWQGYKRHLILGRERMYSNIIQNVSRV